MAKEKERKEKIIIEKLASKFHDIYQKEAKRQGDVRYKDKYEDLPENIKEFDRVLARYVLKLFKEEEKNGWRRKKNYLY